MTSRAGFLLGLFFDPEDGVVFLWGIGWASADYIALHSKRQFFIATAE
jgi:hypothetical protein